MAGGEIPEFARSPFGYYSFFLPDAAWQRSVRELWFLPWYAAPGLRASFLRPISSYSLHLDHLIAPGSAAFAHAQSIGWYLALVAATGVLYRRLLTPTWIAALATLVFAVAQGHGMDVGWVANRNALCAMTFATIALSLHVTWRARGSRSAAVAAPVALLLGLLSGEMALCVTAYFFSYAVFVDGGPWRDRLLSLVPGAVVCLAWQAAYRVLGYGAGGSGVYIDPVTEPTRYIVAVAERLPALLMGALTPVAADVTLLLPPEHAWMLAVFGLALVGGIFWVLRPWLRTSATARFFVVGAVISALPLCATFASDRLLLPVTIGTCGFLAEIFGQWASRRPPVWLSRPSARVVVVAMIVTHLLIAPLALPYRTYAPKVLGGIFHDAAATLDPFDDEIDGRTLVFASTPDFFFGPVSTSHRAPNGHPWPRRMRTLHTGWRGCRIAREDQRTVRVTSNTRFLPSLFDRLLTHPDRHFEVGQSFDTSDTTIEVTAVDIDGWPTEIRAEFDRPLEDPSLLWVVWTRDGYARFALPAVGENAVVEPLEFAEVALFGVP